MSYPKPNLHSNNQIRSLDKEHIKLLNEFIHKHGINKNINTSLTDIENFKLLKSKNKKLSKELYTTRPIEREIERAKYRAYNIVKYLKLHFKKLNNIKNILDVGSGNGLIGKFVSLKLNSPVDHIDPYVKEIKLSYENKKNRFMKNYDSLKNKYDLILFITAAHHVLNFTEIFDLCIKHLSPGGIILFREHRPINDQDKIFLDLCDHLWEFVFTDENSITLNNYKNSIPSKYFFKEELDYIFSKYNLTIYPDEKVKNYELQGFICYFAVKLN